MILHTVPTWRGGFWKEKEGGGKLNLNITCGTSIHIQVFSFLQNKRAKYI